MGCDLLGLSLAHRSTRAFGGILGAPMVGNGPPPINTAERDRRTTFGSSRGRRVRRKEPRARQRLAQRAGVGDRLAARA